MSFPFPINPVDGQTVSHITANGDLLKATYDASKNNWNIERAVKPAALTLAKSGASIPTATADKQVMMWDQTANQWVASSISLKTTDLGDVDGTVTPADQYFLLYDGALNKYVPKPLTGGVVLTATTVGLNVQITTAGSLDAGLTALFKVAKPLGNPKGGDAYVITAVAGNSALDNLAGTYLYSGTAWIKATSEGGGAASQYRPTSTIVQKPGKNIGDLDILNELNNHQLNVFDGGTFQTVFSEIAIKQWIAAGSLFQGTLKTDADLTALPAASSTNRGFYWTWTGEASHVITAPLATTLQVGDWIQSDGTKYIHVPSDLMSKQRWESVGSFRTWADGSYEVSTLVYHNNKLWKATSAINLGDTEPGVNANWQELAIKSSLEELTNVNDNVSVYGQDCVLVWDETNHEWTASRSIEIDDITFDASGPGTLLSGIADHTLTVAPGANEHQWAASVAAVKGAIAELNFEDLADTKGLRGVTDGQVPKWDATNNVWKPGKSSVANISDVGDVEINSIPDPGDALAWTGTKWVPSKIGGMGEWKNTSSYPLGALVLHANSIWLATESIPAGLEPGTALSPTTITVGTQKSVASVSSNAQPGTTNIETIISVPSAWNVGDYWALDTTGLTFPYILSGGLLNGVSITGPGRIFVVDQDGSNGWLGKGGLFYIPNSANVTTSFTVTPGGLTSNPWKKEINFSVAVLSDVNQTVGPTNGQTLVYQTSDNKWHYGSPTNTLSGLTDTTITAPAVGQNLTWNGTKWINSTTTVTAQTTLGDIKQSILQEAQFKAEMGTDGGGWVLADGRDVTGSRYQAVTGNSRVPDLRGAFLRMAGQNATTTSWIGGALGSFADDTTRRPRSTAFTTDSQGNHNHSVTIPLRRADVSSGWSGSGELLVRKEATAGVAYSQTETTNSTGAHTHTITGGGDTETAPKHYAVNYYIKIN